MPTRTTLPPNPLKILFAGLIFCLFILSLMIFGGIYWIGSALGQNHVPTVEFPAPTVPRPRAQPSFPVLGTAPRLPPAATKNAILASRTNALAGDDLFKDVLIPHLKITVPAEGMSSLSRSPRKYVRATIQEGDATYSEVAIRLKGGPGSYRDLRDHPAFTVNFDEFAPNQKFHGLKKIHLNNSVQDGSYLEEKISRELFEAADVPVPRAGHAYVTFNGREMGLYVLVEGINKQFLKRYFKDNTGNVYDGKSGMDVTTERMQINSGDNRRDHSGKSNLVVALREPVAGGARLAALEKTLDIDRFLSYMAMEMILWHWDGYTMARNNWRIFHDKGTDRIVFIPQGVDQMFNNLNGPIFPDQPNGMVARAVLQVPELRERYFERVAYITTNVFVPDAVGNRILEVSEKVEKALAEYGSQGEADAHRSRAGSLRNKVKRRAKFLQDQMFPEPTVEFDASGTLALEQWEPQVDIPEATLVKEKDADGNYLLQISTKEGCIASWRTSRLLPRGKYRFDARIKTEGVTFDPKDPKYERAGAGLRISRHRNGQKNEGDKDWTDISFEFDVTDPQREIELICELYAAKGSVWFDLKSLRLKRL
jgi:spore coat protein H